MDKWIKNLTVPVPEVALVPTAPSPTDGSMLPSISALGRMGVSKSAEACPYCASRDFVRRGTRKNKYQVVQLYICKNPTCGKTFTAQDVKGKHFPLDVIIEAMSYYNLGFTLEDTCRLIKQKFGVQPEPATLSEWIEQYKPLCRYERLRSFAIKMFKPQDVVEVVTMAHRQLYRFRYHRAKTMLMLEEFKNYRLSPFKEYLDNVSSTTPHQYFQQGERMSEIRSKFDKAEMIVKSKNNYANRLATFVLQAVKDNQQRHEAVQRFMLANDSCTVATEVPVYIRKEDVEYMENTLKFKIVLPSADVAESIEPSISDRSTVSQGKKRQGSSAQRAGNLETGAIFIKGDKKPRPFPKLLTGHIDLIQIRNGMIHLLDFKPHAAKEKPIEQLTWYALALSRLTGLRLFEFKCGWFDEKDYFEFYPLHVVKKISSKRKRKVRYRSGLVVNIPQDDILTIVK